jgi:hypothetical protein
VSRDITKATGLVVGGGVRHLRHTGQDEEGVR